MGGVRKKLANVVLSGSLDYISLGELIQLLGGNGSSGVVRITSRYAEEPGWVYFQQGTPVDARNGQLTGLEAANSLFGWTDGRFEFSSEPVDMPNRIRRTRMELVLDGCRMLDDGVIREVGPVSYERPAAATAVLERIPLVKGPVVDYTCIVEEEEFSDGDEILVEGLHGGWIWTLLEGRAGIVRKTPRGPIKLLTLGAGSFLGSIASLAGGNVRSASCIAEGRVLLGVLDIQRLTGEFVRMSAPMRSALLCLDKRFREAERQAVQIYLGGGGAGTADVSGRIPLLEQGTRGAGLLAIAGGDALVTRRSRDRRVVLARLGPGDVVGPLPFCDMGQEPDLAGVHASPDAETLPLDGGELQREFDAASMTFRNIAENLAACVAVTSMLAWDLDAMQQPAAGKREAGDPPEEPSPAGEPASGRRDPHPQRRTR